MDRYTLFTSKKYLALKEFVRSKLQLTCIVKLQTRKRSLRGATDSKPVHILINALPKSASLFIVRTIAATLDCETMRVGTRGVNFTLVDPEAIHHFVNSNRAVAQDHIAPTQYNSSMLYYSGLTQFVVVIRDPRDALVSWAYHLEREDISKNPWHEWLLFSSGIISEQYYKLNWHDKLNDLIKNYFPIMIDWINGWVMFESTIDKFNIMIKTYEEFIADKPTFIESILKFYGFPIESSEIIWPSDSRRISNTINLETHFRKGIAGSHLDELTKDQIQWINKKIDTDLFERFNWSF